MIVSRCVRGINLRRRLEKRTSKRVFRLIVLRDFLSLDEASFREVFRQTPVRRLGHRLFLRNCLVVAGNSRDRTLLARLRVFARGPDPLLAEHAAWAVKALEEETSSDA